MNPKIDDFINRAKKWQTEIRELRKIVLDCQLVEELKWGVPCYTFEGKNIVLIHGFKDYCALLFMKGAVLQDSDKLLIQQTANVQSGRQIRFQNIEDIRLKEAILKAYIFEAIEVEKAGINVIHKKTADFLFVEELKIILDNNSQLKEAFETLSPGRQRAYLLHFSQAKQTQTRENRIQKVIPRILQGKGLNDCVCGLSKRMPSCDGSHNTQ
jgi:uncharacterized protein YdeI (YjbR/CyaY-like superfamily)